MKKMSTSSSEKQQTKSMRHEPRAKTSSALPDTQPIPIEEALTIERMSYGSAGIARRKNGQAVFVEGALTQDMVQASIVKTKKTYAEAVVTHILKPSPHRIEPICDPVELASGAPWAALHYSQQQVEKTQIVRDALIRIAHMDSAEVKRLVQPIIAPSIRVSADTWGYRNKLELELERDITNFEKLTLGVWVKNQTGSLSFAPLKDSCLFDAKAAQSIKNIAGCLRFIQGNQDLGIYRVGLRYSRRTKDFELALWTTPGPFPRQRAVSILQKSVPVTSLVRVITKGPTKARAVSQVERLFGKGCWTEVLNPSLTSTIGHVDHKVSTDSTNPATRLKCRDLPTQLGDADPTETPLQPINLSLSAPSFFQVNTKGAEALVSHALRLLDIQPDDVVMDLYSGAGTFTLALAQRASSVYAVEAEGSSVRDLRRNLERNYLNNVEVIGGDVYREFPNVMADLIVVDPPRSGLTENVIAKLSEQPARKIVYVSCNPTSLARDLARFKKLGNFKPIHIQPLDMFPHSFHVETVTLLSN